MHNVGIDVHKQTISVRVVNQGREVVRGKQLPCRDTQRIAAFFEEFRLIEPLSDRMVPAHAGKLRVIAEAESRVGAATKRKSDKLDAQVPAEFPAMDRIAVAHRPTPRARDMPGAFSAGLLHRGLDTYCFIDGFVWSWAFFIAVGLPSVLGWLCGDNFFCLEGLRFAASNRDGRNASVRWVRLVNKNPPACSFQRSVIR